MNVVAATFVFAKAEGNVGEPLQSQLVITSYAQPDSAPISLSEVKIVFEGGLRSVRIVSDTDIAHDPHGTCEMLTISLQDSGNADQLTVDTSTGGLPSLVGKANLTFSPSQTRIFNLTCIPREAGDARVASLALILDEEDFHITYVVTERPVQQPVWWGRGKEGIVGRRVGRNRDTLACRVLPKPPKVRITAPDLRDSYYTDEQITLDLQVENCEDEAADISVEMRYISPPEAAAKFHFVDEAVDEADTDSNNQRESTAITPDSGQTPINIQRRTLGVLSKDERATLSVAFTDTSSPADYKIEVTAYYHLVSDAETPIFKTITIGLSFVRPFEANYDLSARIHPAPWPDFFHPEDLDGQDGSDIKAEGLLQRWNLNSKMVSFAVEPVIIEEVNVTILGISGGVIRHIGPETRPNRSHTDVIRPEGFRESNFLIDVQRLSLNDRQGTILNLALEIRWRRQDQVDSNGNTVQSPFSTTLLPVTRYVLPMGEPRVLATATQSPTIPNFIHLDYILENPSLHFLTFNLTMEPSDQFAFSGPKALAVQLVPLSRHTIRFNLLCHGSERWVQPQLVVVDSYYNKTLRVLPTEGMRADKKGIAVWVQPSA